ncbi:Predicted dithiol-disulfide isomerase, DsbA family [Modestobacter sp. DSM 44400]|uniref:DsbA family protein n=1 Tax=Modestobacter sp. DSM 44400 TaxID=1550230 RepID=UPI00089D4CC3|nr:DsbA family protein [Modestobacter sp. DSM 44400]SDY81830.1 Predicted dithiol-disulfide isomerase, DsbA family [Modestobacter sp. DSM 44400]
MAEETVMAAAVFFDYTCGFSNRARHWLDHLDDVEVSWRPFSLLELHRADDGPTLFQQPDLADNVSLIALAVHEAVGAEGGDVDGYRRRMFTAWHEEPGRLSTEDILGFGRDAGLRGFDRDAAFAALAADHAAGQRLGVFGTPTLVFDDGQAAFVKLDAVPDADRARPLWDTVSQLATAEPALREWQRVTEPIPATRH